MCLKILVCGDRNWIDKSLIEIELVFNINLLSALHTYENVIIIEGGSKGADSLAREIADNRGYQVNEYKANWKKYGKAAGPIRNREMIDKENPQIVIAFHDCKPGTQCGTQNTIDYAISKKIRVVLVSHRGTSIINAGG